MTPTEAADRLLEARRTRTTLTPFTDDHPDLDETWGYAVQDLDRARRRDAGERQVGAKLGLTSRAKQQRMGVDRPIVGFLGETMSLTPDQVALALPRWAQPRIEPEIAFVTAQAVSTSLDDHAVLEAVAGVQVAAEVIDSRWTGYRFRLADVLADNTSAAGVLLGGAPVPPGDAGDLAALRCTVTVDGEVVHRATGAAILGHPLRALQVLSHHLERRGETLPAGSLVLAGALTDAVPLTAGRSYELSVEGLGSVRVGPRAGTDEDSDHDV